MARAALKDVVLPGWFQGIAAREGGFTVNLPGTSTAATVYQDATGTTALTQPVAFSYASRPLGFVEPGDYSLSAGLVSFNCQVAGGSQTSLSAIAVDDFGTDPALAAWNFNPYLRNSVAVSATSGTNRYIRIVPKHKIVAAKVVVFSGGTATA